MTSLPERTQRRGRAGEWLRTTRRPSGGPVVFLHIGAPKTGTTFLQDVMWHHRHDLAREGVLFTRKHYGEHYQATLDLRGVKAARAGTSSARGAWDRVARRARSWRGTAVISHELFAPARPRQVRRALRSLEPAEVHIVYTVRDLWRQLPAEWQESTKHGRALTFTEFLDDVIDTGRNGTVGRWFWGVHDVLDVLRRWGADLPPDRVHVVTVPPSGADPGLLWHRFAGLLGIDPQRYDTTVARPNATLGAAEVGLLRRVNAVLPQRLPRQQRMRYVKDLLAQRILVAGANDARIVAPPERFAWAQAKAEEYIDGIRAAGYDVVGDLDELRPAPPQGPYVHPDEVAVTQVIGAAVEATARLALHMARMREAHGVGVPPGRATSGRRLRPRLGSRLPVPARLRNSCERAVRKLRRTLSR